MAVIDEFQVLLAGNDALAREAVALLEELARKGRSYGIHLVLASQSMSGIEALYGRPSPIFGQFPLRVALPGGAGCSTSSTTRPRPCRSVPPWSTPPPARPASTPCCGSPTRTPPPRTSPALRHDLWQARAAGLARPGGLQGYEAARIEDDRRCAGCAPGDDVRWRWSAGPSTST